MFQVQGLSIIISSKVRDFCNRVSNMVCTIRSWTAHRSWAQACLLRAWATHNNICKSGSTNPLERLQEGGSPGLCMRVWHRAAWTQTRWYKGWSCRPRPRTGQVQMSDMLRTQLQRRFFPASSSWWRRALNCSSRTKTSRCKWKTFKPLAWGQITPKATSPRPSDKIKGTA